MFIDINQDRNNIFILIVVFIFISIPFHFLSNRFYIEKVEQLENHIVELKSKLIEIQTAYDALFIDYQDVKRRCRHLNITKKNMGYSGIFYNN